MTYVRPPRKPRVVDDLALDETAPEAFAGAAPVADEARIPPVAAPRSGWRWLGLLLASIAGLWAINAAYWLFGLVDDLIVRTDWIGWLTVALISIAALAIVVLLLREAFALLSLRRLETVRRTAYDAVEAQDDDKARRAILELESLYKRRDDLAWAAKDYRQDAQNLLTNQERLAVLERRLMRPLDEAAKGIVAEAAKRVAAITAISPFILIDAVVILVQNAKMLRRLATLYGARPGLAGLWRLGRMTIAQIAGTSLIELAGDHIPTAALRTLGGIAGRKVGEGVFNAAMTARLGTTASGLCRPMPYVELGSPSPSGIIASIAKEAGGATLGYVGGKAAEAAKDAGSAAGAAASSIAGRLLRSRGRGPEKADPPRED